MTLRRYHNRASKVITTLLFSLSLASIMLTMADPWMQSDDNPSSRTLNAVILLDVSRTMLAEDVLGGQSRLEVGVKAVESLLNHYPDGQFSLIMYTDQVVHYGMTTDHDAIKLLMNNVVKTYSVRGEGTNTPLALQKAARFILDDFPVNTVFLLTDGGQSLRSYANLFPGRDTAINNLLKANADLIVVGIGSLVPTTIPVYNEYGELTGYHHYKSEIVLTDLQEQSLKSLTEDANGYYLRLKKIDDLVRVANLRNLDSQPVANEASVSLVWVPAAISLFFFGLWLVASFKK